MRDKHFNMLIKYIDMRDNYVYMNLFMFTCNVLLSTSNLVKLTWEKFNILTNKLF